MLHIKDIEAFATINEALFRTSGSDGSEGGHDLSNHPAVLLARLMAAAQAAAEEAAGAEVTGAEVASAEVAGAEVVQLVPPSEGAAADASADTVGSPSLDFDPAPARPLTMAGLFSRMMFGRR